MISHKHCSIALEDFDIFVAILGRRGTCGGTSVWRLVDLFGFHTSRHMASLSVHSYPVFHTITYVKVHILSTINTELAVSTNPSTFQSQLKTNIRLLMHYAQG